MSWNASEGVLDKEQSSIEKMGKVTNIHLIQLNNGAYILKFLGLGNAFSGYPYVLGKHEYNSFDEALEAREDYLKRGL